MEMNSWFTFKQDLDDFEVLEKASDLLLFSGHKLK